MASDEVFLSDDQLFNFLNHTMYTRGVCGQLVFGGWGVDGGGGVGRGEWNTKTICQEKCRFCNFLMDCNFELITTLQTHPLSSFITDQVRW